MTEPVTNNTGQNDPLLQVREGMEVVDREGHNVGKVEDVFVGAVGDTGGAVGEPARGAQPATAGQGSIVYDVARVFSDSMPEVMRKRLQHNGFVRVNGGLLGGSRFALREQVAAVEADRVVLNVGRDELVKR